jgi:hypothetical protein
MMNANRVNKTVALPLILALLLVTCLGKSASAQPETSRKTILLMEAYCKNLDRTVVGGLDYREFFQEAPQKPWREHTSKNFETANAFRVAAVWPRKGSPLGAAIDFGPRNHVWSKSLMLYFRANGTLIKSHLSWRESIDTDVHQIKYFDGTGKQVYVKTRSVKGKNRQSKSINFSTIKVPHYRTIKELPFFPLLAAKGSLDSQPQ